MENTIPLTEESFHTEYNDMDLNVRIVENLEEAINHVNCYSTSFQRLSSQMNRCVQVYS